MKLQNFYKSIVGAMLAGVLLFPATNGWADEDRTVTKLKEWCEQGNSSACFEMGERYRTLDRDNKTALQFFRKGCEHGHMTACTHAGILIQNNGKQYSPEWKEAAELFQKSCDAGEDRACFNLGALKYREGRAKRALKYFEQACKMGNPVACDNVKWLNK